MGFAVGLPAVRWKVKRLSNVVNRSIKIIFLLVAFVFPISIFVFLKLFGKNEFDVPALFTTDAPPAIEGCPAVKLPYAVPDSVQMAFDLAADSLTVIFFEPLSGEELNQRDRVKEQTAGDPVHVIEAIAAFATRTAKETTSFVELPSNTSTQSSAADAASEESIGSLRRCVFFLRGDTNVVMLDRRGIIRGQYKARDRDEMDRLLTEITILLGKY